MASTELCLGDEHLADCLALSKSANWNQNEADWRLMLGVGRGWGITLADRRLVATTIVLPYGGFAWVSMVLVLPEHRGKGFATRLLRVALADLENRGQTPILDATPAGHEVYVQEGFGDSWGFKRFALNSSLGKLKVNARQLESSDWLRLLRLDAAAFGGSREGVLRNLAARQPKTARVVERNGEILGFVLGREGREALQLGPLIARDDETAIDLLGAALAQVAAPVYVDITNRAASLQSWARNQGFTIQRPFTRMVRGAGRPVPGDPALVFCPAGPELG